MWCFFFFFFNVWIIISSSWSIVVVALIPYPKIWNQKSSRILRTIHPDNLQLDTDIPFLQQGIRKRISHWFRLVDNFQNYPINPFNYSCHKLNQIHIQVLQPKNTQLLHGIDESYRLILPTESKAILQCQTVFGALRGLETFSQLIQFGWIEQNTGKPTFTLMVPQILEDAPAYPYRGLLIDTSRHYLPMELLLSNLDAMAMNKLNVLHWHMTDSQSWPFQSQIYPELSDRGAFRTDLIYTPDMIQRIVQEAYYRGIRVIPEFDLPGHTYALGNSHPEFMSNCGPTWNEPLNPTNTNVYKFIQTLHGEIMSHFPADMIHLGGDEVDLDCWKQDSSIQEWMTRHHITNEHQLFEYFETKLFKIIKDRRPIVWQEVFDLNITIPQHTIIDVWKEPDFVHHVNNTLFRATLAGYHVILSSCWYLDHLNDDWRTFYNCDPRSKLGQDATPEQHSRIMGGHASMWGEHVDSTNFMSRVWPRASSMAERLWSGSSSNTTKDILMEQTIQERMSSFRCHLLRQGIDAGPVGPGYCEKEPTFPNHQIHFHPRFSTSLRGSLGVRDRLE
jgi:hexosaminidase